MRDLHTAYGQSEDSVSRIEIYRLSILVNNPLTYLFHGVKAMSRGEGNVVIMVPPREGTS